MKAIVNTAPGRVEMQDLPLPEPGPGQVRIRTRACAICATDLEMIAGWDRTSCPSIPGHEWEGMVDAVGPDVDDGLEGTRCVAENVLSNGGEVGFEHPGGYGEYFLTEPHLLHSLPDAIASPAGALIEPLAVSVRALTRLRLENLGSALVLGDGPIGLIMLMLLKKAGVRDVMLVGGRPHRLELGREAGASVVVNYHEVESLTDSIAQLADGPFPNTIECTGSGAAMDATIEIAASGGKILVIGDYAAACASFEWNALLHKELELIGSNASAEAWPEAVRAAASGDLMLDRLITHRLPAAEFAEGLRLMREKVDGVTKVVLQWETR